MIKRLKRKFILLATVSMFLLMTLLVSVMNVINYSTVLMEADAAIRVLSQPNAPFFEDRVPPKMPKKPIGDFIPHGMSPEVPYESRFFTARLSHDGELLETDISRVVTVESTAAEKYVARALKKNTERGFIENFRFFRTEDADGIRIVFLDCGRKLGAFYHFMWISISIGLLGCVLVFVIFLLAAGRIVRPIVQSYEKQKRFITDAGHEMKTPLTIINANLDLLSDDMDENEYLTDIRQQTKRLSALTHDLVYLSRMEEEDNKLQQVAFPISDLVSEVALSFQALAASGQKTYTLDIQPNLSATGSPDAIRQLISILLENAMKYSPEGGHVVLEFGRQKKNLLLSVCNTTIDPLTEENLEHLFDRFYRTDASRNSATGGHGIGLSIARAITEAHGGKITAETKGKQEFCITVTLPQRTIDKTL